jgi:hypothetical protein
MKTIDLSKVILQMVDRSEKEYDLSKELAEVIFQNTQSIPEHNFALELYKDPVVELTEENKKILEQYSQKYFKAFVQVAVTKLMNEE